MEPKRIGFVGAGTWMQTYHLPAARYLADRGELLLHGIFNRTREKATEAAGEFGVPQVFRSSEELIGSPGLDGVVIAVARQFTPTVLREAARNGVPVLVEKPPADTVTEMRELCQTVGVANLVAFNRLYTPLMQNVREAALRISPYYLLCWFSRRRRDDPRFVTETGIHALANADWLFGPGSLQEARHEHVSSNVEWWSARMRYPESPLAPNGLVADFVFHPWSGRAVERYQLTGSTGTVEFHTLQHYAPDDTEQIVESEDHAGELIERRWVPPSNLPDLERAGYIGEHRAFLALLHGVDNGASNPEYFDLVRTLRVMELAQEIERS